MGEYCQLSALPNRVEGKYEFEVKDKVEETVIYGGYLIRHWGHFLLESIARLWYALEVPKIKIVFMVEAGNEEPVCGNFREVLDVLGVWERIEIINQPRGYREVIIPELAYERAICYHPKMRDIFQVLRERIMSEETGESTKVQKFFFSRRLFAHKTEVGLEMLDDLFDRNGYQVVYPEQRSLREVVKLLSHASEIIAESGTVAHNILLAPFGTKLTIIERQPIINPMQIGVDCLAKAKVTYVDGHYALYPVSHGIGPYLLAYNRWLTKWIDTHGYQGPAEKFQGEAYRRDSLWRWLKIYRNWNYMSQKAERWTLAYADTMLEAQLEAEEDLQEYLSGVRLLHWRQLLEWRGLKMQLHLWLGAIQRIMRK